MGCLLCDYTSKNKKNYPFIPDNSRQSAIQENGIPKSSIDIIYSFNSSLIETYYTLDINLGEGDFGTTIKLIEKSTKNFNCLKILPKENLISFDEINEVKPFYEKMKNLSHPNINPIKTVSENEDNFFIIREMSENTLQSLLHSNKKITLGEIKAFIFQILSGISYLHDNELIHGNIKPENVLIFDNNLIKLNDYSHYEKFLKKTKAKSFLYSSPELAENSTIEKSDEWSCGVLMYYICCEKYPFNGSSVDDLYHKITNGEFEQSERYRNLPYEVQDLISKLLIFNPKFRISANDALNHPLFEDKISFFLFDGDEEIQAKTNDIIKVIKMLFVFILIFHEYENKCNMETIFEDYISGEGEEIEKYQDYIKDFMVKNLICYDGDSVKNILDYLSNNKIYLFGENSNIVFNYFSKDNSTITIRQIIEKVKTLLSKYQLSNNLTMEDEFLNKDITINEFKKMLNENVFS